MHRKRSYSLLIFFLLAAASSFGQAVPPAASPDTLREFEILRAPSMRAIKVDSVTTLQTLAGGGVIVKQESTLFKCDSAVINPVTHILEAFGNIEINQADTVHTYGQYLKYLGVEKTAHIEKKVKLTSKTGTLFTEVLDYNLNTGIGNFTNGGRVIEGKNVITSLEGTYYDDTKDVYFKKNVKLDGPKNHVRADSLLYNMQTRKSTFISPTHIKNDEVEILTTEGNYDLNTGNALFTNRTTVKDSSNRIYTANSMALEEKTGNVQMEGNAIIIDTAGGYSILANQVFLNKKNNSFLATRKPVLILKQKNDSTYIGADTIFSGYTTFVNRQSNMLTNDSVVNVNLAEDKKVSETLRNDSTPFPVNVDSVINASDHEKRLLPGVADTVKDHAPVRLPPKGMHHKEQPLPADSLKQAVPADSVVKPVEKTAMVAAVADTIPAKDSMAVSVSPLRDTNGKDSARISEEKPLPDSTGREQEAIPAADSSSLLAAPVKDTAHTSDTAIRYFIAYHHVKIYNDSLQSVCDSLFISSRDSVFRLYYDPVVWSGQTQITGDTIFLFTKKKQPERLYVFENGLIVNRTREGFFNQMSGKTINGYFIEGKIDYMRVKGSQAESIYYLQNEDSAYIGMNRAAGDVIDLYFRDDDLKRVLFINAITGKMYPMNQVPPETRELKLFKWLDARRPKNKAVIFE